MGTVSIDNQLPSGAVYMGIALMVLMAAGAKSTVWTCRRRISDTQV